MAIMRINYCGSKKINYMKKKNNNNGGNERQFLILDIKTLVRENLKFCNPKTTPFLCKHKETKEGYEDIENFCVKAFFETDLDISRLLIMKENMLNPNYSID
jgi:hypothetical protein